jgi:hypothetical protein
MHITIKFAECSEELNYVESSARIRSVSVSKLMQCLVHRIMRDQLILAVLDDSDNIKSISDESIFRHYKPKYRHAT